MTSAKLRSCGQCAHMNPPDARFCNQCGKPLADLSGPQDYTPRHLSDKILKSRSAMEGERKQVTVVFVDVKGSVALSQQVEAEQWHLIMDRFFAIVTEAVHDYEGTVNQYTGDGVMALFGAPIAHEDHALRACRAALAMRRGIAALAVELEHRFKVHFAARIGMNSGEVIVGRIGDDLRMDYTAQGQTVGLAARMEQLARPNTILMSAHSHDLVARDVEVVERGSVSVKGFDQKIRSYELSGLRQAGQRKQDPLRDEAPLIGRERELSQLEAYRQHVLSRSSGLLVSVSAATGLGKSRLCHAFVERCRAQGVAVYSVRGSSHHRAEVMEPFREFFCSFFELDPKADPAETEASIRLQLAPYEPIPSHLVDNLLAVLLPENEAEGLSVDPLRRVELARELMLRLVRDGALHKPAVCIVENIHWLDDHATSAFFDQVFSMLADFPLLVIVTARSDYVPRWSGLPHARELQLRPLDEAQSRAFLDHLLGVGKRLDELKQHIVDQAGGNPMFLAEVVRQLLNTGVLARDSKGMQLKGRPDAISLPPSVQAVVAARIDALPELSKRLLQTAAVIGRRVPRSLLRDVFDHAGFEPALAELLEREFLREEPDSHPPALYFNQSLFQTVAYDALLLDQRRSRHLLVAQTMEAQRRKDPAQMLAIARHYSEAGQIERAVRAYLVAAERSSRSNLPEALRYLESARQLLDRAGGDAALNDLHLRVLARWLQFAARLQLDGDRIEKALVTGFELIDAQTDDSARALFELGRGSLALARGEPEEAVELYREALDIAAGSSETSLQIGLRVPLVYGLLATGALSEALVETDAALAICQSDEQCGASWLAYSPGVALTTVKALTNLWRGELALASEGIVETLAEARQRGHGEQLVGALAVSVLVSLESGRLDQAEALAAEAMRLALRLENEALLLMARTADARCVLYRHDWSGAVSAFEEALARIGRQSFGLGERARLEADLSLACLLAGNARRARDMAAQALRSAEASGARIAQIEARLAQVRAGLYSSRPLGFLKRYQPALDELQEMLAETGARLFQPELDSLKARWLTLKGEAEDGLRLREQAERTRQALGLPVPLIDFLENR